MVIFSSVIAWFHFLSVYQEYTWISLYKWCKGFSWQVELFKMLLIFDICIIFTNVCILFSFIICQVTSFECRLWMWTFILRLASWIISKIGKIACFELYMHALSCTAFTISVTYMDVMTTYPVISQHSFPYISAMVSNGSLAYDHGNDGRSTELGGCSAEIRNKDHDTYLAIRYSRGRLTVRVPLYTLQYYWSIFYFFLIPWIQIF